MLDEPVPAALAWESRSVRRAGSRPTSVRSLSYSSRGYRVQSTRMSIWRVLTRFSEGFSEWFSAVSEMSASDSAHTGFFYVC
jgi:hypothetical protein